MSYKLQATKNYGLFELSPFNRDAEKIKRLIQQMKTHGFIPAYPLHVRRAENGKLRIVAGHHRFKAAMELQLAVYYVICNDTASVYELEWSTNHWNLNDFVDGYSRQGNEAHKVVADYAARTGIGLSQAGSMLSGQTASSGHSNKKLKEGTYTLADPTHAETVGRIVEHCKKMGIDFATHSLFVSAISMVVFLSEFDADTFIHRLAINLGMAKRQPTRDSYLDMIDAIYNRQAKSKIALSFLAKEAARQRAAVKKPTER